MIKGTKQLPREEEEKQLRIYKKSKDPAERKAALDKIVKSNQGFIYNVAYKAFKKYLAIVGKDCNILELDDLINIGNLGLLKAIETYDLKEHTRLLTYAGYWIIAYIDLYLKKELGKITSGSPLDDCKEIEDSTWEHDKPDSLAYQTDNDLLLASISSELSDDEKVYLYLKMNSLFGLTKEEMANIMLKASPRSLEKRQKVRQKLEKVKDKIK